MLAVEGNICPRNMHTPLPAPHKVRDLGGCKPHNVMVRTHIMAKKITLIQFNAFKEFTSEYIAI